MNARLEGRIERLTTQMSKLAGKVEAVPDDPRVEQWKARWLECQRSLEAIRDTGKETIGAAPVGVEINVPAVPFAAKEA